jgi:hypothetical protein
MHRLPQPRVLMLLASVCVLVAVTAGVALAAGGRTQTRTVHLADAVAPSGTLPDRLALRDGFEVRGRDVITVPGTKCPKSHPRRIGSSSSTSSSQVNGGPITSRRHHSVVCSR